jgi:hypothetical protein
MKYTEEHVRFILENYIKDDVSFIIEKEIKE